MTSTAQRNPIGPNLPDRLKQMYLEEPARKKAAALYKKQNPKFKLKEIHQTVEVGKLNILDTRKMKESTSSISHHSRSGRSAAFRPV